MYIHVHIQDSNTHTSAAHARVLDLNLSYYFASKMRKITEESVRLVALIIINLVSCSAARPCATGSVRAGMDIGSRYARGGPAGLGRPGAHVTIS